MFVFDRYFFNLFTVITFVYVHEHMSSSFFRNLIDVEIKNILKNRVKVLADEKKWFETNN